MSGQEMTFTPLRSVLYMPSSNDRALEKARTIACDGLILDLEDAVAPDAKESAREAACAAAGSGDYGRRTVTIRVNGIGTDWHDADMAAASTAGPAAIVVPQVNSADAVRSVVIDGALHQNGMVSFKVALTADDAEAVRQYVIKRANEDKALEAQGKPKVARAGGTGNRRA